MNKIAVYTAITKNRDFLREEQITTGADFICFTDDSSLKSDVWKVRKACNLFTDPTRNARIHKILAHKYLNQYKYVIWMDANVSLMVPAKTLIDKYLQKKSIALFKHNTGRDCIYEEAEICKNLKLDSISLIDEQVAYYKKEDYPEHNGLFETTILLRKNCNKIKRFNNFWWAEICKYSKRDQLSFNYSLSKLDLKPNTIKGTIIDNEYFKKFLHPRLETIRTVLGSKMQLIDGDMGMSKWITSHDSTTLFEGVATQAVIDFIKPGMVCIDIGANVGYYTLFMAKQGGFVHAIEPVLANIKALKRNIELNRYRNIKVYQLAIGASNRKLEIATSEHSTCGRVNTDILRCGELLAGQSIVEKFMVDAMALDDFRQKYNINKVDFLKMDVEGYEVEIIKGMKKTMKFAMSKGSMLFIELHPKYIKDASLFENLLNLVEHFGFSIQTIQNLPIRGVRDFKKLKKSLNKFPCPRIVFRKDKDV